MAVVDDVVMQQRRGVDELDHRGERDVAFALIAAEPGAGEGQHRPQTFAAGEQTIAHSLVKRRRLPIRLGQIAVQGAVDQLLARDEIVFEIHVSKTAAELLDFLTG